MSAEEKDKINEYKRYEYSMLKEEIKNKKRERETNRYYLIKAGKYLWVVYNGVPPKVPSRHKTCIN